MDKVDKISIIGTGIIGSNVAYTLMLKGLSRELLLVNRNEKRARAKAADLMHCTPIAGKVAVRHGSYEDMADSDIVVVTAGVLPGENGTRMDVLKSNIGIYKDIIPKIAQYCPEAVIIVVTNPMDVMTWVAYRLSGFPSSRVIGSGTLLDSIRFRCFLGEEFDLSSPEIDALILGEHGDTMIPIWSQTKYKQQELEKYIKAAGLKLDQSTKEDILYKTKRAGWEIRLGNEHSCYGISMSVVKIIEEMLGPGRGDIPVSTYMDGLYGISGIYMSLPARLGLKGLEKVEEIALTAEELRGLKASAETLLEYVKEAEALL